MIWQEKIIKAEILKQVNTSARMDRYEYRYKDEITRKRKFGLCSRSGEPARNGKKIKDMDDLLITDSSVKKLTVNTLCFSRYMGNKEYQ